MAQTVQLKRSSVASKVPTTSDLALGEIAINTYDGKVFIKKDDGTASIVEVGAGGTTNLTTTANSSTITVASDTGTDATLVAANSTTAGVLTATTQTIAGEKTLVNNLLMNNGGGDEGGEIRLAAAATNSSLSGPIAIDIYQNRLRIFETGGSNRGAYIDLTSAGTGVGSNLLTGGSSNTVPTNLSSSANGSTVSIFSDTGTDAIIVAANSTTAGVLTSESQTIGGAKTFTASTTTFGTGIKLNGASGALTVGHTGTYGYFLNTTGGTDISGSGINLIAGDGSITHATFSAAGGAQLRFNDVVRLQTTSSGATVTGTIVASSFSGSLSGNATTATTLQTARTISLGGDLSGSASFNGSTDVTITATVQPNSVALGTDTTGDYVSGITNGTGVTVSGTAGEGWSPTISIGQDVATTANVQFNNLVLSGNLTVNGTTTTISANNLSITDNLIYLNEGSTVTNPDLGFTGNYNDGTYAHTGVFRDATDNRWKFFKGYTLEPGITIDTTHASFQLSDVQANTFYGALSGNATTATTLQTTRTLWGQNFDGSGNITGDLTSTGWIKGNAVSSNGTYGESRLGGFDEYGGITTNGTGVGFWDASSGKSGIASVVLQGDALTFLTGNSTLSTAESMRIDAVGNMGLGTISPETKLHIDSGAIKITNAPYSALYIDCVGGSNDAAQIDLVGGNNKGSTFQRDWYNTSIIHSGNTFPYTTMVLDYAEDTANSVNSSLFFGVDRSTRVTIKGNGNVGIGTQTPAQKLDVVGNIKLSGGISANGSFGSSGQVLTSNGTSTYWSTPSTGGGGGTSVTVANTAPSSPTAGSLWFDTNDGSLNIYFNDGDSNQWVTTSGPGTGQTQGGTPVGKLIALSLIF
jgi:hypothetical protein